MLLCASHLRGKFKAKEKPLKAEFHAYIKEN